MIPTNLFAVFILPLAALDPQALRQELDSAPWHPAPGTISTKPADSAGRVATVAKESHAPTTPDTAAPSQSKRIDGRTIWQLQLAALANPDVAQREQARLEKDLGAGAISLVQENGLTKLRWGRFTSREAADAARAELKSHRLDGFPVKTASP